MSRTLLQQVLDDHKSGHGGGIPSVCSAHPAVIDAAVAHAVLTGTPLLVEATCNQVNQFGGSTGLTPAAFYRHIRAAAAAGGLPAERLFLGGDHLGPSPWQEEPAGAAMDKARVLVRDFTAAGFMKVHLDASMRLGDDPPGPPAPETVAARAADLAAACESAAGESKPLYVIGTEVPIPGGAQQHEDAPTPTSPEDAAATIELTRRTFAQRGLSAAWERVVAVVVQPGVEFGDEQVFDYDPVQAAPLSRFIETQPGLVYEAHSTDYQTGAALRNLVRDHFAILKVGPALTFAYREAIVALEAIERAWLGGRVGWEPSGVGEALEAAMLANPVYWRKYYPGDEAEQRFKRWFSLSDRIRYYWPEAGVQAAVARLMANLSRPVPYSLLSQYMPRQAARVREGQLENTPAALAQDGVAAVLEQYTAACGSRPVNRSA
jgi:D-tagatose-1,6-bisphosphate aldolase subunit GatZ/KbaZ